MSDVSGVARELRLAREEAGLTREQAAEKMHVSASLIDKVERGVVQPSPAYVQASSIFPPAPGMYERLRVDERRDSVVPDWFRPWVDHEQEASEIRWYEPLLIPGLCQTAEYATALLGDPERVAARLERQGALERAEVTVIVTEHVLRYQVGDASVMAGQLAALVESRATVHVLPDDAETHLGTLGTFVIAAVDGESIGYTDTPARGYLAPEAEIVSGLDRRWRGILAESLPRSLSRELILKEAEQWRNGS